MLVVVIACVLSYSHAPSSYANS